MYDIPSELGILADDLTGATDTAVQFAKQGLSALVIVGVPEGLGSLPPARVLVIDTESRHMDPAAARESAAKAAHYLGSRKIPHVYKKVDSVLRGNVGVEIEAAMETVGVSLCILAPAFPANGRITRGCRQMVNGFPLERTEVGTDILSPATTSFIPDIISAQSGLTAICIDLEDYRDGRNGLVSKLQAEPGAKRVVAIVDAETQEDLRIIAEASSCLNVPHILAGSAGLAAELTFILAPKPDVMAYEAPSNWSGQCHETANPAENKGGILVVAGSATNTTRQQIEYVLHADEMSTIVLSPNILLSPEEGRAYMNSSIDLVIRALDHGRDALICLPVPNGRGEGSPSSIAHLVAGIARGVAESGRVGAMVLTGGDTACSVFAALEAGAIWPECEIRPGIPRSRLIGGPWNGLYMVTKSGGFGEPDALYAAVRHLREILSR